MWPWKSNSKKVDPNIIEDAKLTTPKLITKYGYKVEIHNVTTEDGCILEMHRIPGSPHCPPRKGKQVCFLQHGVLDSSASWILSGPNHGLGYKLANEGYDVWLGNSRGNRYSTAHVEKKPYSIFPKQRNAYWTFTWHEMGKFDLPACIDYVLRETGQSKLQYIGHSQGTTAFFVMMSEKPEYNDKIEIMHAMAPIAFLGNVFSPTIRAIVPFIAALKYLSFNIGINFISSTDSVFAFGGYEPIKVAFKNLILSLIGYNTDQQNHALLPVIVGHIPAGCSVDQLFHFGQLVKTGRFQQYDHDFFRRDSSWDSCRPLQPEYNLKNVKSKVALYYSDKDWLADVADVQKLKGELPNVIKDYLIPEGSFNHLDLLLGLNAPTVIFDEIIKTIKSYNDR